MRFPYRAVSAVASIAALTHCAPVGGSRTADTTPDRAHSCTRIIGFSQTMQWFGGSGFESVVDGGAWEIQWAPGADVDTWARPFSRGWIRGVESRCATGPPNRVLLTVSGDHGSDVEAWAEATRSAIRMIRRKIPTARAIVLQPVVGDHLDPPCDSRASRQHPHIEEALERVASEDPDVEVGASPHVESCEAYDDGIGHLTPSAASAVGRALAEAYGGASP